MIKTNDILTFEETLLAGYAFIELAAPALRQQRFGGEVDPHVLARASMAIDAAASIIHAMPEDLAVPLQERWDRVVYG